jgi:predicted N-formylglutamate amidohydrolase
MTMSGRAAGIAAGTAESFEIIGGSAACGLVVLCDHACNALPETYGTLGLAAEQFHRHIAYDIGAEGVTRQLAAALGVPAVLTRFSRLLIDPNRGEDDPTLIMRLSDGAIIPGNRYLDAAERERRTARYYRPYHDAIRRVMGQVAKAGVQPVLFGMHSFTPAWKSVPRPWHCGVLWDGDTRIAMPLLAALRAEGDLVVGDNEPYPGQYEGDTMWQHGTLTGAPFCSIEVRQDLIAREDEQRAWGERLARVLGAVMARMG